MRASIGTIMDAIVGAQVGTTSSCAIATAASWCRGTRRDLSNNTALLRRLACTRMFVKLSVAWVLLALPSSGSLCIRLVAWLVREVYTPRIAT